MATWSFPAELSKSIASLAHVLDARIERRLRPMLVGLLFARIARRSSRCFTMSKKCTAPASSSCATCGPTSRPGTCTCGCTRWSSCGPGTSRRRCCAIAAQVPGTIPCGGLRTPIVVKPCAMSAWNKNLRVTPRPPAGNQKSATSSNAWPPVPHEVKKCQKVQLSSKRPVRPFLTRGVGCGEIFFFPGSGACAMGRAASCGGGDEVARAHQALAARRAPRRGRTGRP